MGRLLCQRKQQPACRFEDALAPGLTAGRWRLIARHGRT
jgi:hypothetical protein